MLGWRSTHHSLYSSLVIDRKPICVLNDLFALSDLNLWPSDLKVNRGHLLIMTNLHVKYEDCSLYGFLVIDQKLIVYRPTDWHTCAKQYTPAFFPKRPPNCEYMHVFNPSPEHISSYTLNTKSGRQILLSARYL